MCQIETETRPSVLIVFGKADRRALLSDLFDQEGYRVTASDDGADALAKIGAQSFDLVISGILMEDIDGLELLLRLAEMVPDLPVIVIGDPEIRFNEMYLRCADSLGAARTHSYPPDVSTLLEGAREVINRSRTKPV